MRKGTKGKPVQVHVEKRECWCEPVWVAGRINPGVLLHRPRPDAEPRLRLEEANQ